MKRVLLPGAVAAALVVAACGGSTHGGGSAGTGGAAPAARSGTTVATMRVAGVGSVLVDARGQALYTPDQEAHGKVLCTGACLSIWMPLRPGAAAPTAVRGAGRLAVITRPDGTKQVTADGRPLYTFAQDAAGKVTGNGASDAFGARHFTWHAVLAGGTPAGASGAPSSGSSSAIPGY